MDFTKKLRCIVYGFSLKVSKNAPHQSFNKESPKFAKAALTAACGLYNLYE